VRRADGEGRVPVVEVLVNIPAVANLIREGKTFQIHSSMQTGQVHGMMTFDNAIHEMIRKGIVSRQEGQDFLARRSAGKTPLSVQRV
jgi:twitching motility protein PilT